MQIREAGFGSSKFGVFEALFGVNWEIDVWGRIRDFQQASVFEADVMNSDYYGARLSLAARVAQSYFELMEAKLLVAVIEQSIKDRTVIASLVCGRFQRDLVRGLDLRLPRITLTAAGGTRSADLTDLIDPRSAAWNAFIELMQPLFTGGRIQGEIFRTQAFAEETLNIYKNTALNAFREVEQALTAKEWLRQQEISLKNAAEQIESSQKMAVYSYRNGLIGILALLDSYRSTLNAQTAHLSVTRQMLSNRINSIWRWAAMCDEADAMMIKRNSRVIHS